MGEMNTACSWKELFRKGFVDQYMRLITDSYKEMAKETFGGDPPWENTRRNQLCAWMQKKKADYGITFHIAPERGVWDENYRDQGRIDLCCYLSELDEDYIAFECKRFLKKDIRPGYIRSDYYEKGIKRFEKNIYSRNTDIGGMIAFLEEGDFQKLKEILWEELPNYAADRVVEDRSQEYDHDSIYHTLHYREENQNIRLMHVLMDFS